MNNCIIYTSFSLVLDNSRKTKGGCFVLSVDLHYLLEKAFSDGFTIDNLSNVTGVSIDLINRVDDKKLTQEDIKQLNSLLYFLSQIYLEDVANGKNLKDIVHILVSHFGLAYDTIAHYLELKTS